MMPPIDMSVVIPTYNRSGLACRAVESALRQTRKAAEIIVVDDGSTDDTRARLEKYGTSIRYIYQANAGASASRNHGVDEARCEWIAFLDSDDVWVEDHLARMAAAIEKTDGKALLYFSDMQLTPAEGGGTLWESLGFVVNGAYLLTENAETWVLMERQPTMLQSSVFSRAAYQQAGGLQKRYRLAHDTHLFAIMGIGQPICAVAGCGTVQTADDDAGTRLTAIHSNRTRNYWVENEALWNDILGNVPSLSREGRRTVRRYRAHARWRLARADWQASEFAGAGKQFSLALATSPGVVANIVLHRFKGGR